MSVLSEIRHRPEQFHCGDCAALYLFGSALRKQDPGDIDFLLVYDQAKLSPLEVRSLRRKTRLAGIQVFGLKCDVVALSIEEEEELSFILTENAIRCF